MATSTKKVRAPRKKQAVRLARSKTDRLVKPGMAIGFNYPRHNFHGIVSKLEYRRVLVTKVRDLIEEPLDPLTVGVQPLCRRSRFLIIGLDLDKNEERSFYHKSMHDTEEIEATEGTVPVFLVEGRVFATAVEAEAFAMTVTANRGTPLPEVQTAGVPLTMFRPACK